jgi:hypothetical protein
MEKSGSPGAGDADLSLARRSQGSGTKPLNRAMEQTRTAAGVIKPIGWLESVDYIRQLMRTANQSTSWVLPKLMRPTEEAFELHGYLRCQTPEDENFHLMQVP